MVPLFSEDTLDKARRVVGDKLLVQDQEHAAIWWVTGSSKNIYRVQTDADVAAGTIGWITCTCPHGLNVGAGLTRCYHAAAVLMTLDERFVAVD